MSHPQIIINIINNTIIILNPKITTLLIILYPLHNSTPPSQCDKHNSCHLSANQHSSPWHTTDMCPLKDPTFILNKIIQERVIQHNNLYGKINKNYNKNMNIPSNNQPPPAPKNTLIIFFDPLLTRHLPTIILLLIHPHHFLLWMTPHHHTHLTKSSVLLWPIHSWWSKSNPNRTLQHSNPCDC